MIYIRVQKKVEITTHGHTAWSLLFKPKHLSPSTTPSATRTSCGRRPWWLLSWEGNGIISIVWLWIRRLMVHLIKILRKIDEKGMVRYETSRKSWLSHSSWFPQTGKFELRWITVNEHGQIPCHTYVVRLIEVGWQRGIARSGWWWMNGKWTSTSERSWHWSRLLTK